LIAAVGGIALTALIRSADAQTFSDYILAALAAVALGGTNLAGGRGGLAASAIGATCIFLLNNLLSAVSVPAQYIQVAYGSVLLIAVGLGALVFNRPKTR
jgi:ribose transport system permease protein